MYNCPGCHKVLKTKKSLNRHIETQHPGGKLEHPRGNPGDTPKLKKTSTPTLEIKAPKVKKETVFEGTQGRYHCIDCGKDISKGDARCPHCGTQLDWSQVE